MNEPDGLDQGIDRLEEVGIADVRDYLKGLIGRHDRAIAMMESVLRSEPGHWWISGGGDAKYLELIAEARGETPEQVLARLSPPPRPEGNLLKEHGLDHAADYLRPTLATGQPAPAKSRRRPTP